VPIKYKTSGEILTLTAGESINQYDYVFLAHETAPYTFIDGITPGHVYKSRKDVRARGVNAICLGFVVTPGVTSSGSVVRIKIDGLITWSNMLSIGEYYQPSLDPGSIEICQPVLQSHENPLAIASSSTSLLVLPQPWKLRGKSYCMAGISGTTKLTTISRFSFSTETDSNLTSVVSQGRYGTASGGVSSYLRSYCLGGWVSASVATVDALTFSTETCATTTSLITATCNSVGTHTPSASFVLGGYTTTPISSVVHLPFSVETWSSVGSLPAVHDTCGGGSSATTVYSAGGTSSSYSNVICGYIFSSNTSANLLSTLTGNRNTMAGMPSRTKLYFGGGGTASWEPTSYTNQVDVLTFSTETCASLTTLTNSKAFIRGGSSPLSGYAFGGLNALTSIDKISLSSETSSVVGSTATSRRGYTCNIS
jgi:hypothetical protein